MEFLGLFGMFIALLLAAVWLYLARKSRRPRYSLLFVPVLLATAGYVCFDRHHLQLNLTMRHSEQVRADCQRLLENYDARRRTTGQDLHFYLKQDLPESFARLGAKSAWVTRGQVQIRLEEDWNSGGWGFLFDPTSAYKQGVLDHVRPLWFRDFYEFRMLGE
jgi:hypothetical protein